MLAVDRAEVVDIAEENRQSFTGTRIALEGFAETIGESGTVQQSGETVMGGAVGQLLRDCLTVGHVAPGDAHTVTDTNGPKVEEVHVVSREFVVVRHVVEHQGIATVDDFGKSREQTRRDDARPCGDEAPIQKLRAGVPTLCARGEVGVDEMEIDDGTVGVAYGLKKPMRIEQRIERCLKPLSSQFGRLLGPAQLTDVATTSFDDYGTI